MPLLERIHAWSFRWIFGNNFASQALTAFGYPFSQAFEWRAWRQLRRRIFGGEFDLVLRLLPMSAVVPMSISFTINPIRMPVIAMGATNHHYLGVDWHLRDVLAWFGAVVVPTSVYLSSADFVEGNLADGAKQDLTALVQALYKLRQISPAPGEYLGPRPLASRRG